MNHKLLFLLLLLPGLALSAKRPRTLRLSTYNIQHGQGMDKRIDFERIGHILLRERPQVIALQEVDSATRRTDGRYGLREMGKVMRMKDIYAPAIDFQGGKYGIGMLCRKRPRSVHRIPLPGREEKRMLLVAEFRNYVVACTHLSLTEEDRMASLPIIAQEAARWQKPFFLMGDLNDEPGSRFYDELCRHFRVLSDTQQPTFPSDSPSICIDYIAVYRPGAHSVSQATSRVGTEQASDHCPLHAVLRLAPATSRK